LLSKNITEHCGRNHQFELNLILLIFPYYFKRNHLSFNIYKNYEDIVKKCSDGWNKLTKEIVKSIMNSKPKSDSA